tara:strand:+ start:538 stop:1146 length:609 start_codon:yes stop_codon:yes gene_type:complete
MNNYLIIFILFVVLLYFFVFKNKIECFNCKKPIYQPKVWNRNEDNIRKYNNCYSYAMKDLRLNRNKKPQPGELCGRKKIKSNNYTCDKLFDNVQCDYPDLYRVEKNVECPCDYYRVALVLDNEGKKRDYHWYRKDNNGLYSHKPGGNKATNLDASKKTILDPEIANRKYKKYNYNTFCGYACKKFIHNEHTDKNTINNNNKD